MDKELIEYIKKVIVELIDKRFTPKKIGQATKNTPTAAKNAAEGAEAGANNHPDIEKKGVGHGDGN